MMKKLRQFLRDEAAVIQVAKATVGVAMLGLYAVRGRGFGAVFASGPEGAALVIGYICAAVWLASRTVEGYDPEDEEERETVNE